MSDVDLSEPLRTSLMGVSAITDPLGSYVGEPSIHTRMPVPESAEFPMIVISSDIILSNMDALTTFRPVIMRDIAVSGPIVRTIENGIERDGYRDVEDVAYAVFDHFHRRRDAVQAYVPANIHVIDVVASGPIAVPAGDDRMVRRVVTLTVRLNRR